MGKRVREYYISIDVEADGPCPGLNSMLQFGAVFYDLSGNVLREFSANIEELPDAVQNSGTMAWWQEQEIRFPGIWNRMMENRVDPKTAMIRFANMVRLTNNELNASPVCVAYPAGYDFTWLYYYLCRFNGESCIGFSAIDLKTMAMTLIQDTYHNSSKKRFPKEWFNPSLKHTHDGLQDARGQGYMFWAMKRAMEGNWNVLNAAKRASEGDWMAPGTVTANNF